MLSHSFLLKNFEGPLELLLCLIQKEELDICAIPIQELTLQMIQILEEITEVDRNSEMLSLTATLLLLKSQKLLPQENIHTEQEEDPRIEIIQNLIEYSRIREAALNLSLKEEQQRSFFLRATSSFQKERTDGLEEIDLKNLKSLLYTLLQKADSKPNKVIEGEKWDVAERISWFRITLKTTASLLFTDIFSEDKCRDELIVTFLALLELMKHQTLKIVKENDVVSIWNLI